MSLKTTLSRFFRWLVTPVQKAEKVVVVELEHVFHKEEEAAPVAVEPEPVKETDPVSISLSTIAKAMADGSLLLEAVGRVIVATEATYADSTDPAGEDKKTNVMLVAKAIAKELLVPWEDVERATDYWVDNVIAAYNAVKDVTAPAPIAPAPVAVTPAPVAPAVTGA
ncbi:hypothetical protein REXELLA_26 [Erwinia phage vB_EamP_Rexella]|uniref:Uncharacterized protein n=1 Tax=Erwinia phage vB_EamP_Rexella TaxID=1852642 RepID=A0A191ZCY5_9CAUD|nr:hypothetical protein REXELLA_26 [Erwinia phage vB_EamP_Rexella]